MLEALAISSVVLLAIAIVLLVLVLSRDRAGGLQASVRQLAHGQERGERLLREEMERGREEAARNAQLLREDVGGAVKDWGDTTIRSIGGLGAHQKSQLDIFSDRLVTLTTSNEQRMLELRMTVDTRLQKLQEDNAARLEQMRQTVDERLTATLEKRLGESFRQVSERLEAVHKGLGEMQSLAAGVGDLKRVLSNVKTRGTWGEVQLNMLLEQVLSPDQYEANVACKPGTGERVEYAVKLPGQDAGAGTPVWLPIDAKFPLEDYQRMLEAQGLGDVAGVELALKALETRVKQSARDIQGKYLDPPRTTDFGIMFLPTEGLYAEVLRRPGLAESLQRDCRVIVAGPTTLSALLNSLQMGFRTLAIEKRSSEVWQLLGAVKTQFGQFGGLLEKVHKKLDQASSTIEDAARKSRTIERRLRDVEEMPVETVGGLLALVEPDDDAETGEPGAVAPDTAESDECPTA
ncbi:MAG: DNA recombination protein RmuC [Thermoleophilia bacterium]|nr:DNA recombination protein RmuC [Thermoleophilia bacterium]